MKKIMLMLSAGILSLNAGNLKDFVENATIDGYARGKYIFTEGEDGFGKGYQLFFRPNITSGEVAGFSFTSGIFFARGSAAPDGNASDDAIGGSRAFKGTSALDFFNISNLYMTKKFEDVKTMVRVGAMQIITPLNNTSGWGDRGIGIMATNKSVAGMEFYASAYDSWATDNIMLQTGAGNGGSSIGNELVILGAKGNFESVGLKDLSATLYYAYGDKLFDMMLFADAGYSLAVGDGKLKFLGQLASTIMNDNPNFRSGDDAKLKDYFTKNIPALGTGVDYAKTRGLYNLQVAYEIADYSGNIGYAGSFGEGYGAMLDGKGAFSVGGQLWNSVVAGGQAGFGWTGTGGIKNTDIMIAYTTHTYKLNQWKFGLDLVYVGGNNRMPYMSRGSAKIDSADNRGYAVVGKTGTKENPLSNRTKDATMFEVSPQVTYQFTKEFSVNLTYSQLFGDMKLNRTVVTLLYNF